MNDAEIVRQIDKLVEEEHHLERDHASGTELTTEDRDRLRRLEVQLDQCWDLLRQRRARRDAGQSPDEAATRAAGTVEHYQQ